jgi:hypothetical protein
MALIDQPYLPLYVDDWMNNTKLKMCSPSAHGLMISIMCLMHKSEAYGIILLKQKFKQTDKQDYNFACQIAKLSSFDLLEIEKSFYELIEEKVLKIEGDSLICSRMVKDADISKKRASSGKSGGKTTQNSLKNFAKANVEANTGIGNEIGIGNETGIDNEKKIKNAKFKIPTIQEIQDYCSERKNKVDADKFFNFYQSKGWYVGKTKMKDWKACVRTWEKNNQSFSESSAEKEKPVIGRMTAEVAQNNFMKFANVKIDGQ